MAAARGLISIPRSWWGSTVRAVYSRGRGGVDGEAGVFEGELGVGEFGKEVVDFAFEAFEVFEGDVEEVSGAAGGVEDGDGAELLEEDGDGFDGVFEPPPPALVGLLDGGGLGFSPVIAEGVDDGGEDESFDVGAGGVVGAELVAFGGVEGAF